MKCATHTWYLAVDFQLYILSPIIILTLMRSQLFGLIGNIVIIIGSSFLCLIPPLLFNNIFPAMYSLDVILDEKTIYDHFLHVSLWTYESIEMKSIIFAVILGYISTHRSLLYWSTYWLSHS